MKRQCANCGKEFETNTKRKRFCSVTCKYISWSKEDFPDGSDFVVCKECGVRARQLLQHVEKVHHMTVEDYCAKHNCTRYDLSCEALHKQMSTNISKACHEGRCGWQKGKENPSHSEECRNGRRSPWSMNYKGYDGLNNTEKKQKISQFAKNVADAREANRNNSLTVEYYVNKGFSIDEAKKKLKERQSTFSLEKCISQYGEDEGRKIFAERQEKWQSTLKSKPIEEIERINKAKMLNGKGYSKISQQLFNEIMVVIGNEYINVYYATNNPNLDFNEYMVHDNNTQCNFFLDFYVKDNNKVIEFDGDYWHGEKRGNQKRDKEREEKLKALGYVNILHVKERDYKANPQKVVDECVEFIRS